MSDVIIETNATTTDSKTLTLNDEETALLDEITFQSEPRIKPPKVKPRKARKKVEYHDEELEAFANPHKISEPTMPPEMEMEDDAESTSEQSSVGMYQEQVQQPSAGYATIDDEKADILNKLGRLEKKGFHVNKKLTIYSDIEELRAEFKRIQYNIDVDQSIRFSRRMLVACITGVEFLNKRYNPFDLVLDGWSENIMEGIDDYDPVFEDLYNKYKTKMKVAPEIKLIMMLGGSATMFHLTNSMFKAAVPNMSEILKQNPQLQTDMVHAVHNAAGGSQQRDMPPSSEGGRREMQGPPIDISNLMGGMPMFAPPPMQTRGLGRIEEEKHRRDDDADEEGSVSDIISVSGESTGGDVKDVTVKQTKRKKKKNEINL